MEKTYPRVSVIIVNFNGHAVLEECLKSLENVVYPDFETILVDNCSSDDSAAFVRERFPRVRLLCLEKNFGFAEGNNRGAFAADSQFLVFLNSDTRVEKNWLTELVKPLLDDEKAAVCASKIVWYEDKRVLDFAGGLISPIGSGISVGFGSKDQPRFNIPGITASANGASMIVRKKVFELMGGFDPEYFLYHEELDLCWRIWLAGFKVVYAPSSVVSHKRGSSSLPQGNWKKMYYVQKNQTRNIIKNFGPANAIRGLFIGFAFDLYRTFFYLFKRRFSYIRAIWQGNIDMIKELPGLLRQRTAVQSSRKISDRELRRLGLLAGLAECLKIVFFRGGGLYLS